ARAEATLVDVDAVRSAAARLPELRADVERLSAGEAEDRRLAGEFAAATAALEEIDRPLREAITTWRTKRGLEEARIRELEAHARAGTSTCATCGQAINEGQALEQLRAARERFTALGDEPKAPLELARRSAAVSRIETRRRDLAWDPGALAELRAQLSALERTAARSEAVDQARETLERERAALAAADEDLEEIGVAGKAARARLEELNAAAAELACLRDQVGEARDELARIVAAQE